MYSAGVPLRTAIWLSDSRLIQVVIPFDVARVATFNQQAVGDSRGPLDGACLVDRRVPVEPSRCSIVTCDDIVIARLEDPVYIRGKLVFRAHLPGQAH